MTKTLKDIAGLQPGYISGGFVATVSNPEAKQSKAGKTFWKCKLAGDGFTAYATSFSRTFEHFNGMPVLFSGMGLKKGEDYNGKMQVSIGDKAKMEAFTGAAPTSVSPEPSEARKPEGNTPSVAPSVVPGVTVGMAINKAVDIAIARGETGIPDIEYLAYELIQLSNRLQAGLKPENLVDGDDAPPF